MCRLAGNEMLVCLVAVTLLTGCGTAEIGALRNVIVILFFYFLSDMSVDVG
jgi:hypothetical protein